jgi:hypothetical protein
MAKKIKITQARKEKCEICLFSQPNNDKIECHRYPPTCDGNGVNSVDIQPLVEPDNWCGEYKKQ